MTKRVVPDPSGTNDAEADIVQWRNTRDQKCRDPSGWLTLVGLHWLKKGANTIGRTEANNIQFTPASCPEHMGTVTLEADESLSFTPHPSSKVTINGVQVTSTVPIKSDFPDENPTTLVCGTISWFVVKRGPRYGLRVKDSDAEVLKHFTGMDNFPINLECRVQARFVRHADGVKKLKVLNALGEYDDEDSHGTVHFTVNSTECSLVVTGDITKPCMLVFSDATSTTGETYPGGRFVWIDPPSADGKVLLDFNKAYNPPCVFTPWATCPLPMKENRLSVSVQAGEKTFGEH